MRLTVEVRRWDEGAALPLLAHSVGMVISAVILALMISGIRRIRDRTYRYSRNASISPGWRA